MDDKGSKIVVQDTSEYIQSGIDHLLRQVKACKRENLYKLKVNDIHCRFGVGRVVNHMTGNSPEQKFNALRHWCVFFTGESSHIGFMSSKLTAVKMQLRPLR